MKSKDQIKNLRKLSISIGNFIRYWGFRRVHGAIWTQVYLSNTPLSCTELSTRLGLSKALISPALDELCKHKLIKEGPAPNEKTKVYLATENINEVIQNVLRTRESAMLSQITEDYANFSDSTTKDGYIDDEKVKSLGEMIFAAKLMLEILISQKDIMNLPIEMDP